MKNLVQTVLTKKRILLVDDDEIFRSEFKDYFEDYGIVEASGGQEALAILKKPNEIDLVILDVRMPGMNGIEALEKIKRISPEVRIIISTGYSSKDVAVEALKAHADDYIEKPFDIDKIKELIESSLLMSKDQVVGDASGIKAKIEKIKDFTERNCYKKVSLNDVAQLVYLSPKYLSRVFKKGAGMGFSEFKLGIKMQKAKELLEKSSYNIDQISDKLAYQNSESFIRQFKKITRYTPTEYRNKVCNQKKAAKRH